MNCRIFKSVYSSINLTKDSMIDLDSSTEHKFSTSLDNTSLPNGELLANVGRLAEEEIVDWTTTRNARHATF